MRKLILGCTSILSAVLIMCTGFLISALKSVERSTDINNGAVRELTQLPMCQPTFDLPNTSLFDLYTR